MKDLNLIATAIVVATGMLTVTDVASAVVQHSWPGAQCKQTSGGTVGFFSGTLFNQSTTSELNLICPLDGSGGGVVSNSGVTVFDRNSNLDVSCTLSLEFFGGGATLFLFSDTQHSTGTNVNPQFLTFNMASFVNQFGTDFFVTCSVPRAQNGNFSHMAYIQFLQSA